MAQVVGKGMASEYNEVASKADKGEASNDPDAIRCHRRCFKRSHERSGVGHSSIGKKIRDFLKEFFVDVETVEKEHKAYMKYKRQEYRDKAESAAQGDH